MKIAIAGMGYVGLSQAVLLAQHNSVCVVDVAAEKVDMLNRGISPIQPGDVLATYADTSPLERDFGFRPATPLREGLRRFARWYRAFYGSQS